MAKRSNDHVTQWRNGLLRQAPAPNGLPGVDDIVYVDNQGRPAQQAAQPRQRSNNPNMAVGAIGNIPAPPLMLLNSVKLLGAPDAPQSLDSLLPPAPWLPPNLPGQVHTYEPPHYIPNPDGSLTPSGALFGPGGSSPSPVQADPSALPLAPMPVGYGSLSIRDAAGQPGTPTYYVEGLDDTQQEDFADPAQAQAALAQRQQARKKAFEEQQAAASKAPQAPAIVANTDRRAELENQDRPRRIDEGQVQLALGEYNRLADAWAQGSPNVTQDMVSAASKKYAESLSAYASRYGGEGFVPIGMSGQQSQAPKAITAAPTSNTPATVPPDFRQRFTDELKAANSPILQDPARLESLLLKAWQRQQQGGR